ncbi:MAG: hypothetical protein O7G83_07690 [Proteobacteria bacterium]|nr:hypothetical protein [Pseudomonadota bacterium]MCZ6895260.1 hypothetical protein [Gammaproteobacteria bacterium]
MNFAGTALVCMLCACANVLDQSAALATTPYTIEDGGRIIIDFVRNRLLINLAGAEAYRVDVAVSPR